jgi:diadenosine tetraphosphate (Ap4A) HIT family hydrolase
MQEGLHMHLHVIPRFEKGGFGLKLPPDYRRKAPRSDLGEAAQAISGALGAQA